MPTVERTDLVFSSAYDIITRGHGGNLKVVSQEGVGSGFIIILLNKEV